MNGELVTDLVIPKGVTSIGKYAITACSGLTSIEDRGTTAEWNAIQKSYNWNYGTGDHTLRRKGNE